MLEPAQINQDYSGIIINQNNAATGSTTSTEWVYQTFRLPEEYLRGTSSEEQRYPSLSGFQLLVSVNNDEATTASFEWRIDSYEDQGWETLAEGSVTGVQAEGEQVWVDAIFDKEIPVTASMLSDLSLFQIGFKKVSGFEKVWYTSPNPLTGQKAYINETLLSPEASLNFRILALSADSGTDWLGNQYRSDVIRYGAENANTLGGNSNSGYWLSAPQPSKFAVVSHYSDLRQNPGNPTYGVVNKVPDPNFEYDIVGSAPSLWLSTGPYIASGSTLKVINSTSFFGKNCLEITSSGTSANEGASIPIKSSLKANQPYTFSIYAKSMGAGFSLHVVVGGKTGATSEHEYQNVEVKSEWTRFNVSITPKVELEEGYVSVSVVNKEVNSFYVDAAMLNLGSSPAPYFDGDTLGHKWQNEKGRSPSIQVIPSSVEEEPTVIDSILMNPITPGVVFNIYYSNDLTGSEEGPPSEEEWEQKLWTHVPQSWVTAQKETYAMPEPIVAKFLKIEFSHLQARSYSPGTFQTPTPYKKFPEWVTRVFLDALTTPDFVARNVGVSYDALEFAYAYYLEDLKQEPEAPIVLTTETPTYPPAVNQVSATTLSQINLDLQTYTKRPAELANRDSILGNQAKLSASKQTNYPVENFPNFEGENQIAVSGLNRDSIVIDEAIPAIFFFITCRHEYQELKAEFDYNRAYFAGLTELAFLRNVYSTESDGELYIESGGDTVNVERNDFALEEGVWYTY